MSTRSREVQKDSLVPLAPLVMSGFPIESGYLSQYTFPPIVVSERIVYVPVPPPASPPEDSGWAEPATVIALFALIVSIGVPFYTWWKDRGDKKKSIEDDYWLRQVVGPIAIEPLLKNVIGMIGETPEDASFTGFSLAAINTYKEQNLIMLAALAVNANSLEIINDKLAEKASTAIDEIQELMIEYCFKNETMHRTGVAAGGYERNAYQNSVRRQLVDLAAVIRKYQEKKTVS